MSVEQLAQWARDAVRRSVRSAARSLIAQHERQADELARWVRKTNDPEHPLGQRHQVGKTGQRDE